MKKADIILIALILASVAFIGPRLFRTKTQQQSDSGQTSPTATTPLVVGTKTETTGPDAITKALGGINALKSLSDEQWQILKTTNGNVSAGITETPGCNAKVRQRETLNLVSREQALRVSKGELNINLGFKGLACFRKGTVLEVLSLDARRELPVVQSLGDVTIGEIIYVAEKSVAALLKMLGLDNADYQTWMQKYYKPPQQLGGAGQEFIMRLTAPHSRPDQSKLPPKVFANTRIYTVAEAQAAVKSMRAIIVDIRSEEEFKKGHIEGAINVPYTVPAGVSETYQPNVPKTKFAHSSFDVSEIIKRDRSTHFIVVARAPDDSRPQFALFEIYQLGFMSMGWIYDGYSN